MQCLKEGLQISRCRKAVVDVLLEPQDRLSELAARLSAVAPALAAQIDEAASGRPCRSSSGLVGPDLQVMAGSAEPA